MGPCISRTNTRLAPCPFASTTARCTCGRPARPGQAQETETGAEEESPRECFICCRPFREHIEMGCGHRIHAPCLLRWWRLQSSHVLVCPYCRTPDSGCYVETEGEIIIGYYHRDLPTDSYCCITRPCISNTPTVIRVTDDRARNLALLSMLGRAQHDARTLPMLPLIQAEFQRPARLPDLGA